MILNSQSTKSNTSSRPTFRLSLLTLLITTGLSHQSYADSANLESVQSTSDASSPVDSVIVTGNRGTTQRTVTKSLSPIDVITGKQLEAVGKVGLLEAIANYVPSFNLPDLSGGDKEAIVRTPTLRGLSAGQILVLVNGKRRHTSAVLGITGLNSGTAPADLDYIPTSLIERVEILRDGAAAQYGSDAIAGVINIILKQKTGGTATTTVGQDFDGQRDTVQQAINYGFEVGQGGILQLALEARYQDNTNQASPNTYKNLYFPLANGSPDPREPKTHQVTYLGYGLPQIKSTNLAYNFNLPINDQLNLYSFSTLGFRQGELTMNYRVPNGRNTITEGPHGYPDGYSPVWRIEERDFQTAIGLKGQWADWNWDLSSTLGESHADQSTRDNQNASFGPATQNEFDAGGWVSRQWVNNFDLSRALDWGLAKPTSLSIGLEHRYDSYETVAGEYASYADGGYIYPKGSPLAGQKPDAGSQVTAGITPTDAAKISRNNYAGYLELGLQPTSAWSINLAGRAEEYTRNVGSTVSGKLSTRYEFTPSFALRGTLSNGFRAPQLANEIYTTRSTAFTFINGVYQSYNYGVLPVNSAAAKALGATPLKPEHSNNYSLGLTWNPIRKLNISLDAFQIDIKDRISLSGTLRGTEVRQILEKQGVLAADGGQYFTNAVDTQTRGIDLVTDYKQDLGTWGSVNWTAAYNYGKTEITNVKDNPAVLSNLGGGYQLIDRQARNLLTTAIPASKLILSADWAYQDWSFLLRLTRYDKYTFVYDPADPKKDSTFGAKWISDLEGSYRFNPKLTLALGAKNIFNIFPDKNGFISASGFGQYGLYSPFGFNGGFYYGRLSYKF
ncbi:TonB-dependent receptor plug domain-containing protein [Aquirhabdus parva]|uniref:TonB-dependent receptor n=1 Tax=Aquirhabdus parva TaxID=2283318 RepID=A0A345P5M5_9GAMM|nr:TonB-dependent receptor [Aquirhabdus parva]AXI02584.1 TonB-dependent receptor [Aquirhabdus parva]